MKSLGVSLAVLGLSCGMAWMPALSTSAAETRALTHPLGSHSRIRLSEPIVVSLAAPGETRWGQHQFVSLSPYPEGKLLLRFHAGEDSVRAYGAAEPSFLSADQGRTWNVVHDDTLPGAGLACELFDGQFLCTRMPQPLDVRALGLELPKPAGEFFAYRKMLLYRAAECPARVRDYLSHQAASRFEPRTGKWLSEDTAFDLTHRLVWIAQGTEAGLISGTTFERPPLRVGAELIGVDYRAIYALPDGSVPGGCSVCCLVSTNNGKAWQLRSVCVPPTALPGELSNMGEPVLCQTAEGQLACVVRRSDEHQKSMLITFSGDQGRTWERPRALDELGRFGVMPDLIRLPAGPMVLSYGRPGVHLAFSLDGSGKTWQAPLTLLAGEPQKLRSKTDGYTAMRVLGPNEFLIAYTDFEYLDDQARKRKAVLVRRGTFEE